MKSLLSLCELIKGANPKKYVGQPSLKTTFNLNNFKMKFWWLEGKEEVQCIVSGYKELQYQFTLNLFFYFFQCAKDAVKSLDTKLCFRKFFCQSR